VRASTRTRAGAPKTLRTLADLTTASLLPAAAAEALRHVVERYPLALTATMAELIERAAPNDPIARQFIPDPRELEPKDGERADPLGEARFTPLPGVIHRYPDRVLLKLTHVCPVYCRFCFRRETVGPGGTPPLAGAELDAALSYIAARAGVFEVILSGGDPFMLAPRRIREITERLAGIPHVKVLRWHTRVPAVAPERVGTALIDALRAGQRAVFVVLHVNHARELTPAAHSACAAILNAGISMLSQTVLLKGINDDAAILAELFRALVAWRIKPYYLHHADLAPGTSHFRTSVRAGQAIVRTLKRSLSGIAQPTYVLDIPGGYGKVPIGPSYLSADGTRITDPLGLAHPVDGGPEEAGLPVSVKKGAALRPRSRRSRSS
jgi:lysine 2,3-aminomutase